MNPVRMRIITILFKLTVLALVFIGLPNPSQFTIDKLISIALFSFLLLLVTKELCLRRIETFLLLCFGLGIYYLEHIGSLEIILLGGFTGSVLSLIINQSSNKSKIFNVLPIIIILLLFLISSIINSVKLRTYLSTDPPLSQYTHDMGLYLKTYYLMGDYDYYRAHAVAFQNHAVPISPPADVWSWRLPTAFYLWKLIPGINGLNIYLLYIVFATLALLATYRIAKKIKVSQTLAIIPVYLLYSYLHFATYDWTLLQIEWWAAFFVIFGLYFLFDNKENYAITLFSLAAITREQLFIPFLMIALIATIYKNKHWQKFWVPVVCFGLMIIFHTYQISKIVDLQSGSQAFHLRLNGGMDLVNNTLAFGSWEYVFFAFKPFAILFFINGLSLFILKGKKQLMLLSFFSLPISYLIIGTSNINQAWGVLYIPIILISTIFTIKFLLNFNAKKLHLKYVNWN